jgi:hypothetical protein
MDNSHASFIRPAHMRMMMESHTSAAFNGLLKKWLITANDQAHRADY